MVSNAKREANVRWDKENMTILGCRVTRTKAEKFKAACRAMDTTPNAVLLKAVDEVIERAEGQE